MRKIQDKVKKIKESGLTIYDPIDVDSPLWFDDESLELAIQSGLSGLDRINRKSCGAVRSIALSKQNFRF